MQALQKRNLFFGGDPESPAEPELVDAAGDVPISVLEAVQIGLHARGADAAREFLIIPENRIAQGGAQIVISRPGARLVSVALRIVGEREASVRRFTCFQSDKRIWDFE